MDKLTLNQKQQETKEKIEVIATYLDVPIEWALAIAMTESSLGLKQKSPTGCVGVFQMSSIAMKDLLQQMERSEGDEIDVVCGVAFLKLLLKRWKTVEEATLHFCDPNDRDFYLDRVKRYMRMFED